MAIISLSNSEFISKVIQDADSGRCFVPLIGSGLSSPSGIIMGKEFTNYLAFATYLVLSTPESRARTHGEGIPAHWDLRHQGWPPLPANHEVELARNWIHDEFKAICDRFDLSPNYERGSTKLIRSLSHRLVQPPTHELLVSVIHPRIPMILASQTGERAEERMRRVAEVLVRHSARDQSLTAAAIDEILSDTSRSYRQRVVEMGIRALHDWRETLVFLASLSVEPGKPLVYGKQNNSVIDSFNSFITRDKQPNLGHKMLAHLSGPLRIHSILTTNFDRLTENAFRMLRLPLRVLPVSSRGRLPEPQTVCAENSLVKLHGEVQDTRADLTLDEEPSDQDKESFVAYLTRGAGNLSRKHEPSESKRLLVIGYSGSDHRCVQMIKHWLEKGPEEQLVYWVCFSKEDEARIKHLFGAPEYHNRVRYTQSSRPDLLLYELYQRLVLSLPPGGLTYEFIHVVPPRRPKKFDFNPEQVQNAMACAAISEQPLEAARVLLSDSASIDDARRLCRDAIVLDLTNLVLKLINPPENEKIEFYTQNDEYKPYSSGMSIAGLWRPVYRETTPPAVPAAAAKTSTLGASSGPKSATNPPRRDDDKKTFEDFQSRPVIIDSPGGVVRAVASAVEELTSTTSKRVFWIETQDYMDADALLRDLLRAISVRCGSFQSRYVTQHPLPQSLDQVGGAWKEAAKQIARHLTEVLSDYRVDANQLVVFIYGRDSYGGCSGLIPSPWEKSQRPGDDPDSAFQALHCIIEALGRAGITTIYFPLVHSRGLRKQRLQFEPEKPEWKISPDFAPSWEDWLDRRKTIDRWQDWPEDPFLDRDCHRDICADHISAASTSVFSNILESVLAPYFDFSQTKPVPKVGVLDDLGERKLIFLYSLTLFRHSRHVNALCSEAVFHCPHRFNSSAIDNDYVRAEEVLRWIAELRNARIFFDKPGGSVWMHRDIRLTIQHLLEHLNLHSLAKTGNRPAAKSPAEKQRNSFLLEQRSRLHFWIGDWYQKAFASSGHLLPIIEAVHHRIMAAIYSPFAAFKSSEAGNNESQSRDKTLQTQRIHGLWEYRFVLFESSILEAQKSLHIGWRALKLWQASPFEPSWLGLAHRTILQKRLEASVAELLGGSQSIGWDARLQRAIDGLISSMEALCQELVIEGGGGGERNTSPLPNPLSSALSVLESNRASSTIKPTFSSRADRPSLDHGWKQIDGPDNYFDEQIEKAFKNRRVGGNNALRVLETVREISKSSATANSETHISEAISRLSKIKANWKSNHASQPQVLHDMIWLLSEYAYLMLRRAKLLYHATGTVNFEHWLMATSACNLGVDFCKHLPPWLLRFETLSKVKLHTLYGVSLANLGRFFEATRHLNEAQAMLSKMPDPAPTDYAIIALRRAEVLLTECVWIELFLSNLPKSDAGTAAANLVRPTIGRAGEATTLKCVRFQQVLGAQSMLLIDGRPDGVSWNERALTQVLEKFRLDYPAKRCILVPPRIAECFRKSLGPESVFNADDNVQVRSRKTRSWLARSRSSLERLYCSVLDEAVALLDQAEWNLSGNSQSSLWWSRLCTLRLRVFGLLQPLGNRAAESLLLRKCSADQGISESFRYALRIARDDPFRQLRALKYFFEANRWHRQFVGDSEIVSRLPVTYLEAKRALELLKDRPLHQPVASPRGRTSAGRSQSFLSTAVNDLVTSFANDEKGRKT